MWFNHRMRAGHQGRSQRVSRRRQIAPRGFPQGTSLFKRIISFLSSSTKLLSFTALFLLVLGVAVALLARHISPKEMIFVQKIQLDEDSAKLLHTTPEILTDLVTERLNQIVEEGTSYESSQLTNKSGVEPQDRILALEAPIKIPVQNDVDFSFRGVSLSEVEGLYNFLRYRRTTIGGDVIRRGDTMELVLTLNRHGSVNTWPQKLNIVASGVDDIQDVVTEAVSETYPELVGRMYLTEASIDHAKLADAGRIFTEWIRSDPRNERPYYYLIMVYESLRSECITRANGECVVPRYGSDPKPLIDWVREVESINSACHPLLKRINCAVRYRLATVRESSTSNLGAMLETEEAENLLASDKAAEASQKLQRVATAYPHDAVAKVNLSSAQDRNNQEGEALRTLTEAQQLTPLNALVAYGIGKNLWHSGNRSGAYDEEVKALHLSPIFADNSSVSIAALREYLLFSYTDTNYKRAAAICQTLLLMEPEAFQKLRAA